MVSSVTNNKFKLNNTSWRYQARLTNTPKRFLLKLWMAPHLPKHWSPICKEVKLHSFLSILPNTKTRGIWWQVHLNPLTARISSNTAHSSLDHRCQKLKKKIFCGNLQLNLLSDWIAGYKMAARHLFTANVA